MLSLWSYNGQMPITPSYIPVILRWQDINYTAAILLQLCVSSNIIKLMYPIFI